MVADRKTGKSAVGDRWKSLREWFDAGAKVAIAAVGVFFAYLADDYSKRTSAITLLSNRETAESELRSRMLQSLIGPFIETKTGESGLKPESAAMLLNLLQLNFHRNFELKPLLLKVDSDLKGQQFSSQRRELRSVARRVVDRQVAMLRASGAKNELSWFESLWYSSPSPGSDIDMYFSGNKGADTPDRSEQRRVQIVTSSPADDPKFNSFQHPANIFGAKQGVCSVSPNGAHSLLFHVNDFDVTNGTADISWQVEKGPSACEKAATDDASQLFLEGQDFTITPYDFPLTDNTLLDQNQRFALNLYYVPYDDNLEPKIQIKLVWFPEGYITERERPMNFYEVNKMLGLE